MKHNRITEKYTYDKINTTQDISYNEVYPYIHLFRCNLSLKYRVYIESKFMMTASGHFVYSMINK